MDISILQIDQQEVARKNQKLLEKTGFVIHQQHGQKIYCDPNYTGPHPPQGTEIYCYRIPRDCFEFELVPVFATCGRIFELRLMIEFSGANRSYCYVRYWDPEDAKMAIRKLHNFHIRPGYPLAVTQSVDNRKLCVKTIPPLQSGVTEAEIVDELSTQVMGVIRVKFIARRWLQLEFESHRHAALARRLLVPGNIAIFGRVEIKQVDWADPEVEAKPGKVPEFNTMPQLPQHPRVGDEKVVVVSNVSADLGEAETRYWFNILTGGHVVSVIKGDSGVFFITLDSVEAALYAIEKGNQMEFGSTRINVASISSQYPRGQQEKNQLSSSSGSYLNQVPPSQYVGPLEQLYNIATKQGWGNPQFSFEQSLSPLGQVVYRYSVSLPKVSTIAVPGEWDSDRSAALINCAVSTLREITQASLQNNYSTPPPPQDRYRTPPPGPPQSLASIQSRRSSSMMDVTTAVRKTKEETNLLAEEDPYDLAKLSSSLDPMSTKPTLAVLPSKKLHKDESHYKSFEL